MADTGRLNRPASRHVGSSPTPGTELDKPALWLALVQVAGLSDVADFNQRDELAIEVVAGSAIPTGRGSCAGPVVASQQHGVPADPFIGGGSEVGVARDDPFDCGSRQSR